MRVDEIRREVHLDAPIEKVWLALTDPAHLSKWFGDTAELDLRPGGHALFGWSEFSDTVEAVIEVVESPSRFSFRWASVRETPVDEASTLVEFVLESEGTRTRLTLVESGFEALPEAVYRQRFEDNESGWAVEMSDLSEYVTGVTAFG